MQLTNYCNIKKNKKKNRLQYEMFSYLFGVYFGEVKFFWIERLRNTADCFRLSSFVESHFI